MSRNVTRPSSSNGRATAIIPPPAEAAARMLAMLRVLVFGIWVAEIASAPLSDLAALPPELLQPPLVLGLVPLAWWKWIVSSEILTAMQGLLLLTLSMAAIGIRPYRLIATVAVGLLTVQQGLIRSYGYSSHEELVALLASYVLVLWPSADRVSWWSRRTSLRPAVIYTAGILLIAIVGCWSYAATAAHRIAHHGLEMLIGNSMSVYLIENSFRYGSGAAGIFVLEHPALRWLCQIAAAVATLFEIAAPLALISRSFRRLWLAFLLTFHVASAALLHVFFWESMLIVGAALLALDRLNVDAVASRPEIGR